MAKAPPFGGPAGPVLPGPLHGRWAAGGPAGLRRPGGACAHAKRTTVSVPVILHWAPLVFIVLAGYSVQRVFGIRRRPRRDGGAWRGLGLPAVTRRAVLGLARRRLVTATLPRLVRLLPHRTVGLGGEVYALLRGPVGHPLGQRLDGLAQLGGPALRPKRFMRGISCLMIGMKTGAGRVSWRMERPAPGSTCRAPSGGGRSRRGRGR